MDAVSPGVRLLPPVARAPVVSRLYGPRGWIGFGLAALVVFVLFPLLNLLVPAESPFHLSAYWVSLVGKIMCYAIAAVALDLV
jgi:urea transport system permease protein